PPRSQLSGELLLKRSHLRPLRDHPTRQHRIHRSPLLIPDQRPSRRNHLVHLVSSSSPAAPAWFHPLSGGPTSVTLSRGAISTPSSSRYRSPVTGQVHSPGRSARNGTPATPTQPIRRAGTPAISAWSGTSLVTTAPAATLAHAPIRTRATHTARAPMAAPRPICTPTGFQSAPDLRVPSALMARGYWSLVSTTAGPMKTPSPSCAGSYTSAWFCTLQLRPSCTPAPM